MTNETENRSPSPWRIGLESARANLVPGIALWTAACALVLGAVLLAANSKLAFLTACGESWGWAFLCLAFYAASKPRR